MRKIILQHEIVVLFTCFVLSRVFVAWSGVHFQYEALYIYWQYLDVDTLQHDLLRGIWYLHAQPPLYNLFAGLILQLSGAYAEEVFRCIFLAVSFCNACLLLRILKTIQVRGYLPLLAAAVYLLSPATILYENELFYTSYTSLLLLLCCLFLTRFIRYNTSISLAGFFGCLVFLCLSRSIFHLLWLGGVCGILLYHQYKKSRYTAVLTGGVFSCLFVIGWYIKNYLLFGVFSVSSWTGINLARIVLHDNPVYDSSSIAAIHPFLPVSYYKKYITADYRARFAGKADKILLAEMKNDSAINMNNAGYIQVAQQYRQASLHFIKEHPGLYAKNVLASLIIFFSPASSYFKVKSNDQKIFMYDTFYSFNLSHFFQTKKNIQIALAVAALPKCLLYVLVFVSIAKQTVKQNSYAVLNACIMFTLFFILLISTLLEYGENMRFRYEVEPIFLILLAQVLAARWQKRPQKLCYTGESVS